MSDDDHLSVEAHDCPMTSCAAPAGSPRRTGKGKVAVQYHSARFRLVPALADAHRAHPRDPQARHAVDRVELGVQGLADGGGAGVADTDVPGRFGAGRGRAGAEGATAGWFQAGRVPPPCTP
ncbi:MULTISPECIES: hypothetical protein [unclassified Nonomuraea]|uniref:zinc finger domain-containing protein n=1 Tax=unclassified Nonomuraea TaxID=2593643 RepID=UPI0033DDE198